MSQYVSLLELQKLSALVTRALVKANCTGALLVMQADNFVRALHLNRM